MRNTVDDKTLPLEKRRELLLKKVPRDLRKWERDVSSCSFRKINKLRRLMDELSVRQDPFEESFMELGQLLRVRMVMES